MGPALFGFSWQITRLSKSLLLCPSVALALALAVWEWAVSQGVFPFSEPMLEATTWLSNRGKRRGSAVLSSPPRAIQAS